MKKIELISKFFNFLSKQIKRYIALGIMKKTKIITGFTRYITLSTIIGTIIVLGVISAVYSVLTSEAMSGLVGNIMGIIQMVVFAFGSIAVLVGGIGIMNTMYTSVRERTKEIGILKAVGAKNKTIILIFLIESGIIGLVGGLGGMIPGLGLAKLVQLYGQVHPALYIEASFTPGIILFGLLFSFAVGCLSGFFPARSAAKLKPVDALRSSE